MTAPDLARRLASQPPLSGLPGRELEWLAAHGEYEVHEAGSVIARRGRRIEHMWIMFSGRVAVHRDTAAGPRRVMEWGPGDVTGRLPFSRMTAPRADIRLETRSELLGLHERHFPEMVQRCPEFTAHTVHLMVDRARRFNTTQLQAEKLVSLGRVAAGLAHELNNPASAAVRGAAVLREGLSEAEAASRALAASGLREASLERLAAVRTSCMEASRRMVLSPLERADLEAELEDWLLEHGCDVGLAAPLAETLVSLETLDEVAREVPGEALDASVRWLAASCVTRSVAAEIEGATRRIHELVAAVKRFTYVDNLAAPDSVDIETGLRDTVTVLAAKARAGGASIRLDIAEGLPPVRGTGGELNQVWMNLIDNALDAVSESGRVEVVARAEGDRVVVSVVDDGPGIPDDVLPQVFDPFFTTKGPGDGTGLGLDIARRLVTRHRGEIDVESRPGRTEFRVRLLANGAGRSTVDGSETDGPSREPGAERP